MLVAFVAGLGTFVEIALSAESGGLTDSSQRWAIGNMRCVITFVKIYLCHLQIIVLLTNISIWLKDLFVCKTELKRLYGVIDNITGSLCISLSVTFDFCISI